MIDWHFPSMLYLILPCSLAWLALSMYSDQGRRRARDAFVSSTMRERVMPMESRGRFWFKLFWREMAIVTGLIALAGPRFGTAVEMIVPRGSDLYVLIDVSRSMLAQDVAPSRLGRAKADVSSLVNQLQGERIGLIAFAGQAVVKCPLTVDYDSFRRSLQELDPSSAPRGGTAIGDAIRKSLDVFQGNQERDQSILLITDGDDQKSYPLEAAAVAAERGVSIFAIGLGDSQQGSRIPVKPDEAGYVEYQGEQVWSKLDGSLLGEIALKTQGIYVPAGTRAYDLGELYTSHLRGRRAQDAVAQERIRRPERFQIFLALALTSLLIDSWINPYRRISRSGPRLMASDPSQQLAKVISLGWIMSLGMPASLALADKPHQDIREGLQLYSQANYDAARQRFAAAVESLDQQKSKLVTVATFDEACAHHRKGDYEKAREAYLRAGLSQDRSLGVAAHYNLGTMLVEQAQKTAGEKPELVEKEKRQEMIDRLLESAVTFRHCLELQPNHASARKNLELVRLWIKYYSDQWREIDRQKVRDESNLIAFLEFLIQSQKNLLETIASTSVHRSMDDFAIQKQLQTELAEEIPILQKKIESELNPAQKTSQGNVTTEESDSIQQGIQLLQSWAEKSGDEMKEASRALGTRDRDVAITKQQSAIDQLDQIWNAVVPFHPLLSKNLEQQTKIAGALNARTEEGLAEADEPPAAIDFRQLEKDQDVTLRKSRLMVPKAEMELKQLENQPPTDALFNSEPVNAPETKDTNDVSPIDPETIKAGYRKAIELAPLAVEKMEAAIQAIRQKDGAAGASHSEQARKILEEIQEAQPKNPNQKNQQSQKDSESNDHQDKPPESNKDDDQDSQQSKENQDKQNQDKKDQEKQDQNKQDQEKSEAEKSKRDKSETEKSKPVPNMSQDRIDEALRRARERQEEKRDRDRQMRAILLGKQPVEKDW